ncbi:RHS repeat-associated core domain-containing protein, partial [Burkholderia ubonensis]|uniref:RHS repeat-associated core domain-containing protein n=1 Tax=Burkholderia ubonensis TaxID=101571 RepID=UPI000AFDB779
PWLGRWLNPDPAGTVDGLNLFRMVRNNPVTLIDDIGLAPTRVRPPHPDSEGDSESEDPMIAYRALRDDEAPEFRGLNPPAGFVETKTAFEHVAKGSIAKKKSRFISASRSIKVAGAWAATNENGRIVKFRLSGSKFYDLTTEEGRNKIIDDHATEKNLDEKGREGLRKQPALNFAKGSQEVVIENGILPENIMAIYSAQEIDEEEYRYFAGYGDVKTFKTRAKISERKEVEVDGKKKSIKIRTTPKNILLSNVTSPFLGVIPPEKLNYKLNFSTK